MLQAILNKLYTRIRKNAASNIEQVLETVLHKAAPVRPPNTPNKNYES